MNKCEKCKCDLSKVGSHGERIKRFLGGYRWIYWCNKCYKNNFINSVESNPLLLSKYLNIYGKNPTEIII